MNELTAKPPGRRRGRVLALIGGACALALATVAAVMPGTARAATQVCSNSTGSIVHTFVSTAGTDESLDFRKAAVNGNARKERTQNVAEGQFIGLVKAIADRK